MEHKGTVKIETERLVLRRCVEEDAEVMFANWASDPEVTKFLRWPAHGSVEVSKRVVGDWVSHYGEEDFYQWAIVPKELGEPIGSISVVEQNEKAGKVHIGYCIGRKWWRQGYTSEALRGLLPFFFREVKAGRVEAQHDPENPGSGKVMEACGLRYEGTLRRADWSNRGIVDACMYGLLAEEFEAGRD